MIRAGLFCVALASALVCSVPAIAWAGDWIADAKTGCKVWNPRPSPGEAVRWTGSCKDGFADGKGVLEWLRGEKPYERDGGIWHAAGSPGTERRPGLAARIPVSSWTACHMEMAC